MIWPPSCTGCRTSPMLSTSATPPPRKTSDAWCVLWPLSTRIYERTDSPRRKLAHCPGTGMSALRGSPDLTLQTDAGALDLLANIPGVGDFAEVAAAAVDIEVFGLQVPTLDLPALIASKRAAGRLKDQLALPQMEATLRLRNLEQPRHLLDDDRGSNEQRDP